MYLLLTIVGAALIAGNETETPSTDPAALIAAAGDHFWLGRYDESLAAYDAASKQELTDAQFVNAAVGSSRVLEETGRWAEAEEAIRNALGRHAESPALQAQLAQLQFLTGRYDECRESLAEALRLDANHPLAHLISAHLARETGQLDSALEEYRWCVRYYNRAQPTDAETLMVLAEGSLEYARWKRVSSIFDFVVNTLCPDALKDQESCWRANLVTGSLLLEKYNEAQANPEFEAALAINPHAPEVLVAQGRAALQDLKFAEAFTLAERALAVNPALPEALLLAADVRLTEGDIPEALTWTEKALAINPRDQRTLARKATIFLLEDGLPTDEKLLELFFHLDAIDQLPESEPSRFAQILIELAGWNPRPGYFLADVGEALDSQRKYDAAERFYRHAINVMPQLSAPRTNLGLLYMRTGKIDEAQEILDEAFRADPFHVRVSNMRKVLDVLQGYETVSTDHFVLRVDGSDRLLAEYMAEYLEEIYPELTERYGYEPPVRTQFEIYAAAKGQGAHQWFSARMIGLPWIQTIGASTGMIVALASPTHTEPFNWQRVLRHEFVHILTLQVTGFNIPHWYTEALAVREEGLDMPEQWQELLMERVPEGRIFNLQTINSGFQRPEGPDDWSMAYCQSRLYAQYLVDEFGEDSLTRLVDAYRNNVDTATAIPQLFGVSVEEFERGYSKLLEETVAKLAPLRAPAPIPLAEAEAAYEADEEDADAAGVYALALMRARRGREAGTIARKAVDIDPSQPEANYVLARFALTFDRDEQAVEFLTAGLDEEKPLASLLSQLARLKLDAGENAEAARLYEIGTKKFPLEDNYWNGLATALWRLGDDEKLQPVLETLAPRDFDNFAIRKKLAEIAVSQERFEDAVRWGREAISIDVTDAEVHLLLGKSYITLEKSEQAKRELTAALSLDPDSEETRELLESL